VAAPPSSIGLIAGSGNLPLAFAQRARRLGFSVRAAALRGSAPASLEKHCEAVSWIGLGQLGSLLSFFREQGVKRAVMHGKVEHSIPLRGLRLDWKALALWTRLKDRSGEALLKAVAGELARKGVTLLDGRFLMDDLLVPRGWLTRRRASREQGPWIEAGRAKARGLARLGVGQTLMVKKGAVVAVEAVEGTDEAILRAGRWAGPGTLMVKVAGPHQDWRFDIPTIGPQTIRSLARARAVGLAVEAGRTFLLEREKTLDAAEEAGLFVLGL
jgi:UDP-2,3-diacylglucosamine hydrolase